MVVTREDLFELTEDTGVETVLDLIGGVGIEPSNLQVTQGILCLGLVTLV